MEIKHGLIFVVKTLHDSMDVYIICSQLGLSGLHRYSTGSAQCTSGGWADIQYNEDVKVSRL